MDKTKLKGVAALIAAAVAVILAAFLCMSFPMAEVHAATTYGVSIEKDLVYRMAYAKEGDTIQLNASLTMDLTDADFVRETFGPKAEPNKDVYLDATTELPAQSQTLDLNGHTLTIITGYTRCFSLTGDVTLTIIDSSAERTGAIVGYSNGSLFYSGTAESSLVLQDVAVKFTEYTEGGASITPTGAVIDTVGDVTLNNVTYTPAEGGPALIGDNAGAQVSYIADTAEKLAAAVAGSSYSTVMLGADITQNITVEAGRTLTLDLNGYTLSSEIGGVATIWNKGTLAIKSSAEGGTITREVSGMYYVIRNNGVMTIDGTNLTVYNDNASDGSSLIDNNILSTTDLEDESIVDRQAKLTITGGTYRSANSNAVKNDPNGTLIIESGSFTSNTAGNGAVFTYDDTTIIDGTFVNKTTEPTGLNTGYAVYATVEDGLTNTLQINGGTFTAEKAIYLQNGGGVNSVTISNGTFNGIVDADNFMYPVSAADTFAVSGGTFNGAFSIGHTMQVSLTGGDYANVPSSDYLAEDVNIYQYTAGDKEGQFVLAYEQPADTTEIGYVMIGSVFYNTLREALAASGSSIYLCRDITESVTYSGTSSKYIYLSGYTWTAEEGSPALTTESGSGRVTLYGGSGGDGLMQRTDEGAVVVNAGSVRFMTSGSHSVAVTGAASGSYALIENSGTLEIRAGRFVCSENGTILQNDGGTVTVLGGTFSSVFDELDSSNSYTYITDGYYLADNGDGTYTVSRVVAWVDLDHNGIMGDGEVFFTSVQDAVAVAQSGDTVVMLYNSSTDVVVAEGQDITLELRSGTLSASITNNGTLTITGTDGRVENGVTNNGTLSIQGGTFKSGRETSDATTNIYLEEVYAHLADGYYFVSCSGNYYFTVGEGERVATIEDGDFTLDVGSVAVAINYVTNVAKSANVTVTLLQDDSLQASTTIGSVSQSYATNVTFDLGGNTLSTGYLLSVYSFDKTSSFYVTITNGVLALSYADDSTARVAISATYQANLTLSDLSVVYSGGHSYDNLINAGNSYGSASSVSTINFVNANVSVADGAAVPTNMVMVYNRSTATFDGGNYFGAISAAEGATITIAEGCVFEEDIKDVLGDGLTQNESGMVVPEESANAVAMIESADGIVYYDTLQAAINAAESGATVTLLKDLPESVTVAEGQEIVLDLNGCTLTNSGTNTIVNNGTLTVMGNGKVDNTVHQGAALQNNGKATLENGTFTRSKEAGKDDNANGNSWYVIDNSGTLTLKKVTVYQGTDEVNALQWTFSSTIRNKGASAEQMAVMEVDGATVVSGRIALKNDDWGKMTIADANVTGGNQAVQNWAQLEINGGTFAGDVVTWFYAIPGSEPETRTHATITGGAFNGGVVCFDYDQDPNGGVEIDQGVTISGDASFKNMPRYTYFAEGSAAAWDEGSQMYVTAAGEYVAAIEGFGYTSLQAAIDAAKDGDTVTLLDDIEFASGSAVKAPSLGIALTIDLNGHRITSADGYSAVFDITTTKSFTLTSSKEGAAIEAAYALRLRGSGTGEVAIAVENIAFSGAYVFNSPLTFGRSNTAQVSVTLRNVRAEYTDNLKNMQSFLLNADRLASLQVTGSTFTVSSKNAEKAQGAYAVNLIATEAAFTDSTIEAKGTLARGIYSHNSGTVISALTLNNTAVTAEDIAIESSYADLTVNGGTVTSNASAAVLFFGHMTPEAAAAAIDTQEGYQTLTVTGGAQISGYTFGIGGNAEGTYDGTVMNIEDAVITGGEEAPGVFQPHVGILNIGGENTKIIGSSGVVVRAGRLNIAGGTFTATYATLHTVEGSGSVIDGAAVAVSHHSSNQPLTVSITGGTFNGVYSVYEDTLLSGPDPAKVSVSLAGGVYNGGVYSENKAGFITGGSFKQQPAEELFDENYAAEYRNGYYVAVRSDALKTARANAQADVRGYAAANGISWLALADEAATAEGEEPVYTAQQAADILAAFNKIDSAMTQLAVAEARLAAMNMVDAYVEALDTYKLDMIGDLQTAAADDEETADVDESVVLPTATYSAIYNATSASEIDFYVENALAEIEAIRSLRAEISGQRQQLADLADALEAMSEGLFGTEGEDGTLTGGAFADLLDKVQDAIAGAQNAIVNGTTGEDGATTSTSLASIRKYLEGTIKNTLDSISSALNDTTNGLAAIKSAIDSFDVSAKLADDFGKVTDAITNAQKAIMGATDESAGTSIAGAVKKINEETAKLVNGLREELIGKDGTSGVLGTIAGYVDDLEGMLDNEESGLAAIVADIEEAKDAIMGVTEEDKDGVSLSEVLGAVNTADGVIDDVLAAVQGLTSENGILTQIKSAVDGLTDLDIGGEFEDVLDAITNAQKAIMGATEESAGTSIAGAVTAITGVVNALTKEGGMVYAINETLKGLSEALTGTENNAFTALAKELKKAIIGTGDATLTEIASGVAGANKAIADVLAAVQGLADADNGIVAQVETALDEMLGEIKTLTGALATSEQVKGIETGIDSAKTEIDKIVAAIGSLGTGEGNDLATQIGGIVSDIEAVQGAVSEIGTNLGVAVDIEESKADALEEIETWLNAYLDALLGGTEEADSGVLLMAVTLETQDGDLYGRLCEAFSEANAQLILKYYNQALTAIDNATSVTDASTAVSTFRAQVASVDAAAQNTPSMTGVYVLLAIVLVVLIAASIVVILKNRKATAAVAAEPAAEAAAEEKPAEEAKPEAAEEAAEEGSETEESAEAEKPEAEEELAADDDDKEQVVIAANVRSFAEAYVELSDEQRELFNKVKEYALGKEGTSEAKLSSGVCVKLGSKQVVKLAVRRGNPVALFVLENEMLKDFRRGAATQAKLKVRATELVLREEADLETAYTMVDLSVDQIKKDAEAAKERRREQRRERRRQRLAEEAARQAEHDGSED